MGLFSRNFDRPGPGVRKDEPRKKGIARLIEVIGRDFGSFFKANLICTAACIPAAFLVSLGLFGPNVFITILGGIIGGMVLAPFYAGMHDTVLRSLRDEPGYWWHTYKKALANNWKQSLLPGALVGFVVASQLLAVWMVIRSGITLTLPISILLGLSLLVTGMVTPFLWGQLVLMDMPFPLLIKNSLLFAFGNAPKAILLAILQVAYWAVIFLFLPFTSLWVILFGFALIVLLTQMLAYPIMDKTFDLEAKFAARREEQLQKSKEDSEK